MEIVIGVLFAVLVSVFAYNAAKQAMDVYQELNKQ